MNLFFVASSVGFIMFGLLAILGSKKKIILLMVLEFLMMWLILLSMLMMKSQLSYNLSFVIILICAMVTESILGLSIVTCFSRNSSSNSGQSSWL